MPDVVESVQEIVRYTLAGGLETGQSERRFELAFGGSSRHDRIGKTDRKDSAVARPIRRADTGLGHFGDTLDDRQAERGTTRSATVAASKPLEDLLALAGLDHKLLAMIVQLSSGS
jgi:hypothetical protein